MSDTHFIHFVRQDLVPERPAPVKTTGFVGFLRTRLFNSPTNILITIVSALLLWFIVVPAIRFLLVDAVWTGTDRTACLAEECRRRGRRLLAVHPGQVLAVHLRILSGAGTLAGQPDLPSCRDPAAAAADSAAAGQGHRTPSCSSWHSPSSPSSCCTAAGWTGFGVSWTAGLLSGFNDSIGDGGRKLVAAGETTAVIGPLLWLLGKLIVLLSTLISLGAAAADLAARADPGVRPAGLGRPRARPP